MQYAQIGDIVFEVLAYKEHKEDLEFPYARHETIKPPSSLQFMGGKELRKISLSVRWHREWCNPEEEKKKLEEFAVKGEYAKFILAEKVIGDFVIEKVSFQILQIDAFGKPVIIDADLELTEYIKKEMEKKKIKTISKKAPMKKTKSTASSQAKYQVIQEQSKDKSISMSKIVKVS
jgi:phage protein U